MKPISPSTAFLVPQPRPRMSDAEAAQRLRNFLTEAQKLRQELVLRGYECTTIADNFVASKTQKVEL